MADLKSLCAVITAGGIGTRLLPFSKEIPKEMSPIIVSNGESGSILVKPIIQAIFEQLYDSGIRNFFTVVGRGKRAIEDHFSPDQGFVALLKSKGKRVDELESFYMKLRSCSLVFVMQPEPLGFGDAVLKVRPYVKGDFLVHAGDTYIISSTSPGESHYLERLWTAHVQHRSEVTVLLQEVKDPQNYGVVIGEQLLGGMVKITKAVEKPDSFVSNTAIMPVYIFSESIFDELQMIVPGKNGEMQLTDAIQRIISRGGNVVGVRLGEGDVRLDIGSPQTLMSALLLSSERMMMTAAGRKEA